MGILTITARLGFLVRAKSDIDYKIMKMNRKIQELSRYAAAVSDGYVTITEMAKCPPAMLGRTLQFMRYAHESGMAYMEANAPGMLAMYQAGQNGAPVDPNAQAQMEKYIKETLYKQERERVADELKQQLKADEDDLRAEKEEMEVLRAEYDEEIKDLKGQRKSAIEDIMPKISG